MGWRLLETVLESVTIGQVVAQSQPDRIALYIVNMAASTVHITTRAPPYASNAGLPIKADDEIDFHWSRDGDLARSEWRLIDPVPPQEMVIIEEIFDPDGEP